MPAAISVDDRPQAAGIKHFYPGLHDPARRTGHACTHTAAAAAHTSTQPTPAGDTNKCARLLRSIPAESCFIAQRFIRPTSQSATNKYRCATSPHRLVCDAGMPATQKAGRNLLAGQAPF